MEFNSELTTICFSETVSYIHKDDFLGESWWVMLPCGEKVTIEECRPEPRGIKGLKNMLLRKSPTAIVCNITELAAEITAFNDQDRYLIGRVCEEGSSIHKYLKFGQKTRLTFSLFQVQHNHCAQYCSSWSCIYRPCLRQV